MKVEELRIGNWVMGYHDPFQWSLEHFDLLKQADLDEIIKEPVLITEEVLLKCGFARKITSNERSWYINTLTITKFAFYDEDENGKLFVDYEEWKLSELNHTPLFYCRSGYGINSLHQLQNLYFSITGEELEVEL